MPIYEYECQKCGEIFESFQKVSDPPPSRHTCGSKRIRRVMSQTSFQLKGSGWYITDYGRSGGGNGAEKSSKSDSTPSETKTETKGKSKDKSASGTSPAEA